jgi:hypothetical protein
MLGMFVDVIPRLLARRGWPLATNECPSARPMSENQRIASVVASLLFAEFSSSHCRSSRRQPVGSKVSHSAYITPLHRRALGLSERAVQLRDSGLSTLPLWDLFQHAVNKTEGGPVPMAAR